MRHLVQGFIVLGFIVISLLGCEQKAPPSKPLIRPIEWTEVSSYDLQQIRTLSGIVGSVEAAQLSFEVSGKVAEVNANLGDTVNAETQLAKLNQRSFLLSIQSGQAQLDQANAKLADAENEYLRYEELMKQGLVSQSGFDSAKAAYKTAQSSVNVAKAQLDIAKKNLQDSVLLAPYDGVITKRLVEPSQQVGQGQTVFEIEGNHGLEVNMLVPETLIQKLSNNMELAVRFPVLPNVEMTGKITEIGTRAVSANAFPVTVQLLDDNNLLRAGMTAEVDVMFEGEGRTGHQGKSIRIPVTALKAGLNQQAFVFVYDTEQQKVFEREVQTENILNNQVYLSSGLQEGDIIATAGVAFLRDGQSVTLLDKHTQRFN